MCSDIWGFGAVRFMELRGLRFWGARFNLGFKSLGGVQWVSGSG